MTIFVICVGSSLLSKATDVTQQIKKLLPKALNAQLQMHGLIVIGKCHKFSQLVHIC